LGRELRIPSGDRSRSPGQRQAAFGRVFCVSNPK
jgi:hypothetical protein